MLASPVRADTMLWESYFALSIAMLWPVHTEPFYRHLEILKEKKKK